MFFWILFIIFLIIFWFEMEDGFLAGLGSIIVSLIVFFIICAFPFGGVESYDTTHNLHALVDNYQTEGSVYGNIFIIRGTIDEELQYQFMYEVEGKGWTTEEIDADRVYLNFNCERPQYIIRQERRANPALEKWFPYFGNTTKILNLPDEAQIIDSYIVDFQ